MTGNPALQLQNQKLVLRQICLFLPATAATSSAQEGKLCIAGISAFEPAEDSSTKCIISCKTIKVSSPAMPSVVLHSTQRMPHSKNVVQQHTMDASLPQQFPTQRVKPVNPTVSTRTKIPSQCEQLIKWFVRCITQIGSFCKLHAIIGESLHPTLHFHRVLDQFAASTVWRYWSIWQQFSDALRDMDLRLDTLTEVELADVFVSLSLAHRSDPSTGAGSISAIKAVRWMTKVADIPSWPDIVYGSIISSYLRSKIPR